MKPVKLNISPILSLFVKKKPTRMSEEPSGALFHQSCVNGNHYRLEKCMHLTSKHCESALAINNNGNLNLYFHTHIELTATIFHNIF